MASAQHKVFDASCNDNKVDATGGTVTLNGALDDQSTSISFSFDLQFEDGTTIDGSFSGGAFCDTSVMTTGPQCVQ